MENTIATNGSLWATAPTAKDRTAVRQAVTQLLDTLAPHRVVKRTDAPPTAIEQHRTPDGCILQAHDAALSVSWFENRSQSGLGELHISVWSGVVTRGGSSYRRAATATIVSEHTALPQQKSATGAMWRSSDGVEFDTASLAAHCIDLLNKQIGNT